MYGAGLEGPDNEMNFNALIASGSGRSRSPGSSPPAKQAKIFSKKQIFNEIKNGIKEDGAGLQKTLDYLVKLLKDIEAQVICNFLVTIGKDSDMITNVKDYHILYEVLLARCHLQIGITFSSTYLQVLLNNLLKEIVMEQSDNVGCYSSIFAKLYQTNLIDEALISSLLKVIMGKKKMAGLNFINSLMKEIGPSQQMASLVFIILEVMYSAPVYDEAKNAIQKSIMHSRPKLKLQNETQTFFKTLLPEAMHPLRGTIKERCLNVWTLTGQKSYCSDKIELTLDQALGFIRASMERDAQEDIIEFFLEIEKKEPRKMFLLAIIVLCSDGVHPAKLTRILASICNAHPTYKVVVQSLLEAYTITPACNFNGFAPLIMGLIGEKAYSWKALLGTDAFFNTQQEMHYVRLFENVLKLVDDGGDWVSALKPMNQKTAFRLSRILEEVMKMNTELGPKCIRASYEMQARKPSTSQDIQGMLIHKK